MGAPGKGAGPGPPRRERCGEAEAAKVKLEEVEEVVICKLERAVEAAEGRAATAGGGGERPGVKAGARGGRAADYLEDDEADRAVARPCLGCTTIP